MNETTPYWTCSWCRGYGITMGSMGDVVDCSPCGGSGIERARDSKGRFARIPVTDPGAVSLILQTR